MRRQYSKGLLEKADAAGKAKAVSTALNNVKKVEEQAAQTPVVVIKEPEVVTPIVVKEQPKVVVIEKPVKPIVVVERPVVVEKRIIVEKPVATPVFTQRVVVERPVEIKPSRWEQRSKLDDFARATGIELYSAVTPNFKLVIMKREAFEYLLVGVDNFDQRYEKHINYSTFSDLLDQEVDYRRTRGLAIDASANAMFI